MPRRQPLKIAGALGLTTVCLLLWGCPDAVPVMVGHPSTSSTSSGTGGSSASPTSSGTGGGLGAGGGTGCGIAGAGCDLDSGVANGGCCSIFTCSAGMCVPS
jgi:hypothetical protein